MVVALVTSEQNHCTHRIYTGRGMEGAVAALTTMMQVGSLSLE